MYILLFLLGIGAVMGICLGVFFRYFTMDDFSMWNNKWFGKNIEKDQSYLDK